MTIVLLLSSSVPPVGGFDVVGWYVGGNTEGFGLEQLRWDLYTHIRIGTLHVNSSGHALCGKDVLFLQAVDYAKQFGTQITLHSLVDVELCAFHNPNDPYCTAYFESLPQAIQSCGPTIGGIEFDYEWNAHINKFGYIEPARYVTDFSRFLDRTQKTIGSDYTVSCDVSVYMLPFTRWVDSTIFSQNQNLFVNTMSYHWPEDCAISNWKYDAWVIHHEWGINRSQINIGIGYFYNNKTRNGTVFNTLRWKDYSDQCKNNSHAECHCNGLRYVSPDMNYAIGQFVKQYEFRGLFPWAADYDNYHDPLVVYATDGLAHG